MASYRAVYFAFSSDYYSSSSSRMNRIAPIALFNCLDGFICFTLFKANFNLFVYYTASELARINFSMTSRILRTTFTGSWECYWEEEEEDV